MIGNAVTPYQRLNLLQDAIAPSRKHALLPVEPIDQQVHEPPRSLVGPQRERERLGSHFTVRGDEEDGLHNADQIYDVSHEDLHVLLPGQTLSDGGCIRNASPLTPLDMSRTSSVGQRW